jgi:hypothetical protein
VLYSCAKSSSALGSLPEDALADAEIAVLSLYREDGVFKRSRAYVAFYARYSRYPSV